MSKEYEESSGSTTEQAADREAASYESSSLLSWKVMLSYFGRRGREHIKRGGSGFIGFLRKSMRNLLALQSWQTKLGVAPYESSSLLSWKVMLSYLVGERRQ